MEIDSALPPWRSIGLIGSEINPIPSMITPDESLFLYWCGREHYRGEGFIVDGGPLLGGSTVALARGVNDGSMKNGFDHPIIFSYDLFKTTKYMERLLRKACLDPNVSIINIYKKNIEPWRDFVCVYEGDIQQNKWNGGKIELMFIDLAKTWKIQDHLVMNFFPHLIPGRSIVIQQDYFFVSCYWIHLLMQSLSKFFEPFAMPDGPTMAFRLHRKIPDAELDKALSKNFDEDRSIRLMDSTIENFSGRKRLQVMTAKIQLLLSLKRIEDASILLGLIERSHDFDEVVRVDWEKARHRIIMANQIDQD